MFRLILLLLPILLCSTAHARLARTTLDALIKSSDLILEATPVNVTRTGLTAGFADLKVLRVIVGSYTSKKIRIKWGDEVHDQQVSDIVHDRLLFLKRAKDGSYQGTHYGRSYWPFTSRVIDSTKANLDSPNRVFEYRYPLTMVTLSKPQRRALLTKNRIRVQKLKQLILKIKKSN